MENARLLTVLAPLTVALTENVTIVGESPATNPRFALYVKVAIPFESVVLVF